MFGQLTFVGIVVIIVSTSLAFVMEPGSTATANMPTPEATEIVSEPTPEPTAEPTPEPPPPAPANRADCNQIRGTSYLSPEERTWFLANCVPG